MNGNGAIGERAVLLSRIQAMEAELDQALGVVSSDILDPKLRDRAKGQFQTLITQKLKRELAELRAQAAAMGSENAWKRLGQIQQRSESVVRECSAFLQGIVARMHGLDRMPGHDLGLCAMADALVRDLARRSRTEWWGLTIPAEEEFVAEMAHIIRIRWADVSLWNLPVVAHEFGHLVGLHLRAPDSDREPLREILDRHSGAEHPKLHEYFADLYAVHALGLSYGCTCLLLRFDPRTAFSEAESHPSEAKRAHFILEALEGQAGQGAGKAGSKDEVARLRDAWRGIIAEAGQSPKADEEAGTEARKRLAEMSALLPDLHAEVAYDGWLRALSLFHIWRNQDTPPEPNRSDSYADVLNAAWLGRLDPWVDNKFELKAHGEKAARVYGRIMNR